MWGKRGQKKNKHGGEGKKKKNYRFPLCKTPRGASLSYNSTVRANAWKQTYGTDLSVHTQIFLFLIYLQLLKMVNKTNWNCSLCATKRGALRGGSSTASTAPAGPWEAQRGNPPLPLARSNDESAHNWIPWLYISTKLACSCPPLLAG